MSTNNFCERHQIHWDGLEEHCPTCEGEISERERIIAVLEKMSDTASSTKTKAGTQTVWVIENAIALIKGGTNG